jgi:hypothetical protein
VGVFLRKKEFLKGHVLLVFYLTVQIIIDGLQWMKGFGATRMLKFREPILAGHPIMTDSIQKQSICLGRLFYGE